MSWVNPDYERIVTANGGITYRRRGHSIDYVEIDDEAMAAAYTEGGPTGADTVRSAIDIVDAIDQLVDEQLAGGPVDDYEADRYDRCPHCGRHWHGLPITQRVADMYMRGTYDESYRVDADDTPVLCEGSDFIGPMRISLGVGSTGPGPAWVDAIIASAEDWLREAFGLVPSLRVQLWRPGDQQRWWRYQTSLGPAATAASSDIGTNFHRYRVGPSMATWDYLGDAAPNTGHTWEPLTAPGVEAHPDDPRPNPHYGYRPGFGVLTLPGGIAQLGVLEEFPWSYAGTFVDEGPLPRDTDTSTDE